MSAETWMAVVFDPRFQGYEVSDMGRVRKNGEIRNQYHVARYPAVCLSGNGERRTIAVHRLVALTFLGPAPSKKHVVNHKDSTKTNNCLENLEWATYQQNSLQGVAVGNFRLGPAHHAYKINQAKAAAMYLEGRTMADIAAHFAVALSAVQALFVRLRRRGVLTIGDPANLRTQTEMAALPPGINRIRSGKFQVRFCRRVHGHVTRYHGGSFDTLEEAVRVRANLDASIPKRRRPDRLHRVSPAVCLMPGMSTST